MKNQLIFLMLILILTGLTSCNRSIKADSQDGETAYNDHYSSHRQEIMDIIKNSPKAKDIIDFLNARGAAYIYDITLPLENAGRFETTAESTLAAGVYSIDLYYAYLFRRYDMMAKSAEVAEQLMVRTGLLEELPDYSRIKYNAQNPDSLEILMNLIYQRLHESIQGKQMAQLEALLFTGANIEAMYLLSQLTLYARDNQQMADFLMTKGEYARGLMRLLEILSRDSSVKPYYEKMKPIVAYFDTHPEMGPDEIKELAGLIEVVRNQMLL